MNELMMPLNPGVLSLGLAELTVSEGDGQAVIPVFRTEGSDGTVALAFATSNDSAEDGSDFTGVSGTVVFGPGETRKDIIIPILDDDNFEASETFTIAGGDPEGAVLGFIRTAIITITDNDVSAQNQIAFTQERFSVNEDVGEIRLTLTRSGNLNRAASVDFTTADDHARAGLDYQATSGRITFAPGETTKEIAISLIEDAIAEPREPFRLRLSNAVGANLGPQQSAEVIVVEDDPLTYRFAEETVVAGLPAFGPTAFDWLDDDTIYIADREGVVRIAENGQLRETPFLDIANRVNVHDQRGLLGLALHPDFEANPYVYLAFAVDEPGDTPDGAGLRQTHLLRVTADPSTNYTTVLPGSETVLLEIPAPGGFHSTGGIGFGPDGALYYSYGDGSQVVRGIENPELLQSIDTPFGKLFRLNPITGEGLPDNPFYNGDLNSIPSKVYNYGLRNPFRFGFHPETGEPFIGDVGWNHWEEINTGRGLNFGWPFFEGGNGVSARTPAVANNPNAQAFYNSNPAVTAPIYARNHNNDARSITLGSFYTGNVYPELYRGALFFGDFSFREGNIEAVIFNEQQQVTTAVRFARGADRVVQISQGPDGFLYYLDHEAGTLNRWVFTGAEWQAEDLVLNNYLIEENGAAEGEALIAVGSAGDTGTATVPFDGPAGRYTVVVGYFEESDGQAQLALQVNGETVESWRLNRPFLGSTGATAATYQERAIADLILRPTDVVTLVGTRQGGENARIDEVRFQLQELLSVPAVVPETIALEAEALTLSGYQIESNDSASGGSLISLRDAPDGTGTASLTFNGPAGVYELVTGYYDESDGIASLNLQVNDTIVDRWEADRFLGSTAAVAHTLQTHYTTNIYLEPGDEIALNGIRDRGDNGRLDSLQLIPSLQFEAEALSLSGYGVETNRFASGRSLIGLGSSPTNAGTATLTLTGRPSANLTGNFDVVVGYFDESDGRGQLALSLNEAAIATWTLDAQLGSPIADGRSFQERTFADIDLQLGDTLTLGGLKHRGENARIDYLKLIPNDAAALELAGLLAVTGSNG